MTICFQVYTIKQEKRGLCPYDDKRYLLADLPDGRPNPNTHAYGHRDLVGRAPGGRPACAWRSAYHSAPRVSLRAETPELKGSSNSLVQ